MHLEAMRPLASTHCVQPFEINVSNSFPEYYGYAARALETGKEKTWIRAVYICTSSYAMEVA